MLRAVVLVDLLDGLQMDLLLRGTQQCLCGAVSRQRNSLTEIARVGGGIVRLGGGGSRCRCRSRCSCSCSNCGGIVGFLSRLQLLLLHAYLVHVLQYHLDGQLQLEVGEGNKNDGKQEGQSVRDEDAQRQEVRVTQETHAVIVEVSVVPCHAELRRRLHEAYAPRRCDLERNGARQTTVVGLGIAETNQGVENAAKAVEKGDVAHVGVQVNPHNAQQVDVELRVCKKRNWSG